MRLIKFHGSFQMTQCALEFKIHTIHVRLLSPFMWRFSSHSHSLFAMSLVPFRRFLIDVRWVGCFANWTSVILWARSNWSDMKGFGNNLNDFIGLLRFCKIDGCRVVYLLNRLFTIRKIGVHTKIGKFSGKKHAHTHITLNIAVNTKWAHAHNKHISRQCQQ